MPPGAIRLLVALRRDGEASRPIPRREYARGAKDEENSQFAKGEETETKRCSPEDELGGAEKPDSWDAPHFGRGSALGAVEPAPVRSQRFPAEHLRRTLEREGKGHPTQRATRGTSPMQTSCDEDDSLHKRLWQGPQELRREADSVHGCALLAKTVTGVAVLPDVAQGEVEHAHLSSNSAHCPEAFAENSQEDGCHCGERRRPGC
mmetsp:Transcript_7036/g.19147  ORF Transcript_7036/g.19147 Transcript_7036/m.19147 type:complete len:205 (-) Transcript_7036:140-754(-)